MSDSFDVYVATDNGGCVCVRAPVCNCFTFTVRLQVYLVSFFLSRLSSSSRQDGAEAIAVRIHSVSVCTSQFKDGGRYTYILYV